MKQTYCVACARWKKTSPNCTEKNVKNVKKKTCYATTKLVTEADDTPSSIKVIKSLPSHSASGGKKVKENFVADKELEAEVQSPRRHASSESGMLDHSCYHNFFWFVSSCCLP